MAKKPFPSQADVSFKMAVERATKHPSQIADIGAVVDSVAKEMQTPDFLVRAELYKLLTKALTENELVEVLGHYRRGLEAADRVGRIDLQKEWEYFFNGEHVQDVLYDKFRKQFIVPTSPRDDAKHSAIYAINLNGRKNWALPMKKSQAPFDVYLAEDRMYFTTDYAGESDDHNHTSSLHGVLLANGVEMIKWLPEDKDIGGITRIQGIFGDSLLVQSEWGKILAIDPETKKEKWQAVVSCELITGDTILVKKANELMWMDKNGKVNKKLKFKSPKKGKKAHISCVVEDGDVLYVAVQAYWSTFSKNNDLVSHYWPILYGVGKEDAKIKWSYEPSYDRNQNRIIVHPDWLYFCGDNHSTMLYKDGGSITGLDDRVVHISDKFIFSTDTDNTWRNEGFTFYAVEVNRHLPVVWQRKNFDFITAKNGLLFGRVGDSLVILDEATGKERARVQLGSRPTHVGFINDDLFWVTTWNGKTVTVFRMEYPEDRV